MEEAEQMESADDLFLDEDERRHIEGLWVVVEQEGLHLTSSPKDVFVSGWINALAYRGLIDDGEKEDWRYTIPYTDRHLSRICVN